MIINSGVTNIARVLPFEVGNEYKKYDVVYYSGYTDPSPAPPTLHPCLQSESGHCYYTGDSITTSTITNRPYAADTEWTTGFFADVSYGATVDYEALNYTTEFGDGYYNVLNKSENAVRATFSTNFGKRTDQETKAIVHILEDSFNRGNHPSGGYSGIPWTPFAPYNQSGAFFVESFTQGYESPDVNSVSTTFFRETASTTNWKTLYIPFENTREDYTNNKAYFQHDATFLRQLPDQAALVPTQTGWYYFTGEKHADYTPQTGILGTEYNSPTGQYPLWTKDNFYFDLNQNISIPQNPRFTKQDLDNGFTMRFDEGINKNLLAFPVELKGRTDKEALAIVHFLEHHAGVKLFEFTPPAPYDFTNKVFLASSWSHTINFKDNNDVTINMREFPIDYLNLSTEFRSLVTVVNRPLKNLSAYWSWPTEGGATGPVSINRYAGSKSTIERIENTDFISNTGMKVFAITGQSIRTGFYLTNSGNTALNTFIGYDSPYQVFDFPSGHSHNPVVTAPGSSSFIPFYFKGFNDNITAPEVTTGPESSGVYTATLTLKNKSNFDNTYDPSGLITFGITGYITGFDKAAGLPANCAYPYRGNDGQTPNHPARFLIQTGYYDASGVPLNVLAWQHPATGHDLNRYSIQYTQDNSWTEVSGIPLTDSTSVRNIAGVQGTGFEINRKYIQSYGLDFANTAGYVQTNFYSGILVPPSLAGDGQIPEGLRNLPDPQNTGIHQDSYFIHKGLSHDQDYYYRMRSEYISPYSDIFGSMYVYASGAADFSTNVSNQVSTGLSDSSTEFTDARTVIPTRSKPAFRVYLDHGSSNINLSGVFIEALVDRGLVKQENGLDLVIGSNPTAADYLAIADTGAYGNNYTGVQFILRPDSLVGAEGGAYPAGDPDAGMIIPAVRTGYQLLTGVVNPADASAGADPNLQKPIAETPSVLVMQSSSLIVGQGGEGGDGGVTQIVQGDIGEWGQGSKNNQGEDSKYTLKLDYSYTKDSTAGADAGDAIYISHPSIDKFSIRKDYNAKIYGGGGGGGGGDRFLAEKIFSVKSAAHSPWNSYKNIAGSVGTFKKGYGLTSTWTPAIKIRISDDGDVLATVGSTFADTISDNDYIPTSYASPGNIIFRAKDFIGIHRGGAGGGGASFRAVSGGTQFSVQGIKDYISDSSYGGYGFGGAGNLQSGGGVANHRNAGSDHAKHAWGGDGGDYGQPGNIGYTFNEKTMGIPFLLDEESKAGKVGGAGGKAIRIISTNTNYTVSNYRGKLLSITPSMTPITAIPGLVGYFEAGNKSYNTGTTEAVSGAVTINNVGGYTIPTTSITVLATSVDMKSGDVIYFFEGTTKGIFTLDANFSAPVTTLTGVLSGGTIPDAAVGNFGQTVTKWVSTNDANVYLEQTTTDNKPTLQDTDKEDRTVGEGSGLTRSGVVTVRHAFFNNQKYIYFSPTLSTKINYMKLHGATSNADYDGDIQINNVGQSYAAADGITIAIQPIAFSIAAGTVITFRGGSIFTVTSAATYGSPNQITALTGNLSGSDLHNGVRGYYRLSSLGNGFDIFYVIYPNRWFTASGNFTAGTSSNDNQVGKDADYQTGWSGFSSTQKTPSVFYNRKSAHVTDNAGLGNLQEQFSFTDRGSTRSRDAIVGNYPRRSWVYNLSGSSRGGKLYLTARNDGNAVGGDTYEGDSFIFNSSGSVYVGGSKRVGSSAVDLGFRGAIAAIVIFNRHLTSREKRELLGVLFNKYLRTKAANAVTQVGLEYQNKRSDLTGIAGQIYFTP